MPGPLNYTTSVEADKTAYECLDLLAQFGASQVSITFRDDKMPDGLSFVLMTRWGKRGFSLTVDADATFKVLNKRADEGKIKRWYARKEQADRVAWRVMKDWLEAQLALIEAGLMSAERVLSPYMLVDAGKTMLDIYAEQQPAIGS